MEKDILCCDLDIIYKDISLQDLFYFASKDYLNCDIEEAFYFNLSTSNVYDILNNKLIKEKFKKAYVLGANDGKFLFMIYKMYNFNLIYGVENTYEFYYLIKDIIKNNNYYDDENKKIKIFNKSLFFANIKNTDLIIINCTNSNSDFNFMLENKIINEAKSGALIIKILTPFSQNVSLRLKKIKKFNNNENDFLVFYYLKD